MLLLMLTGARIAEVLGADVRDYGSSQGHRTLRAVRKGSKRSRLVLPAAAVRALEVHLAGRAEGPLFCTEDGTARWSYSQAARLLERLFAAAGVSDEATAHSFRRSYATEALGMGVPLQDVQDALGHADPRTTRRYDRGRGHLDRSPNDRLAATLLHPDTGPSGGSDRPHPADRADRRGRDSHHDPHSAGAKQERR